MQVNVRVDGDEFIEVHSAACHRAPTIRCPADRVKRAHTELIL